MMPQRLIESSVGLFLLLALIALTTLAFKVSGLTSFFPKKCYMVVASFDDIGGLKIRSPVKIGGVQIGQVSHITLDPLTFKAIVQMQIEDKFNDIPDDSTAGILTAGLLGDNYIAITPMYNQTYLKNGSEIQITRSAMILEKLIGQFIYKIGNGEKDEKGTPTGDKTAELNTNGETHAH